jgi:hypothetical protein
VSPSQRRLQFVEELAAPDKRATSSTRRVKCKQLGIRGWHVLAARREVDQDWGAGMGRSGRFRDSADKIFQAWSGSADLVVVRLYTYLANSSGGL